MACCEVLFGTVPPTASPTEAQIPIYIDRTSKKVYYWNGTGWELIWEIQTAGVGTPGVVSIDPNSPIYVGEGGTLQINCERLKTQCGFATVQEVSEAVSSAINSLVKSLNTTLQEMNSRITSLGNTVAQVDSGLSQLSGRVSSMDSGLSQLSGRVSSMDSGLSQLAGRVSSIEGWDLCAKTAGCGRITSISSNSPEIKVSPATGIGNVILTFLGGNVTGNSQNGFFDIGSIRVQWGTFMTTTGNMDTVTMQYPFGDTPYVLLAMERNAVGWTGNGAGSPMPTVYGTQNHPTTPSTKFLVSCVRVLNNEHAAATGKRTKYEVANGQWFGIGLKP